MRNSNLLSTCLTRWLSLLAPLALALPLQAAPAFDTRESVVEFMTHYYQHPEPTRTAEAVLAASRHGFLKDGKRMPPLFGFLAGWFSKNPALSGQMVDALVALPPDDLPVLVIGLWYSGVPQSEDLLVKLSPRVSSPDDMVAQLKASAPRPTLMEVPLEEGAWVLDALWGNFMATGDAEPVVRIMSALRWADKKGDIDLLMIGRAAQWSLTSNAQQHPRVLAICRAQLANQPAEIARVLRQVISDAQGKSRAPE